MQGLAFRNNAVRAALHLPRIEKLSPREAEKNGVPITEEMIEKMDVNELVQVRSCSGMSITRFKIGLCFVYASGVYPFAFGYSKSAITLRFTCQRVVRSTLFHFTLGLQLVYIQSPLASIETTRSEEASKICTTAPSCFARSFQPRISNLTLGVQSAPGL
jgi:hypothetical protein